MGKEESNGRKYVLAVYDVRGKQKFIYRSEHLKEIIGGSAIIRDVFEDYFYPAAIKVRNAMQNRDEADQAEAVYNYRHQHRAGEKTAAADGSFSFEEFEARMQQPQYIGEVIYDGGGNFLVLFRDADICRKVTSVFSETVLKKTGSLKIFCTFVGNLDPEHFGSERDKTTHEVITAGDCDRLYQAHRINEGQEASILPYGTLPIVQADYLTSMPLTHFTRKVENKSKEAVTTESFAKYEKYREIKNEPGVPNEEILDKLVEKKGEESLLAVLYMDGNSMGAKVAAVNEGKYSYDECVTNLRRFSQEIQETFIDGRLCGIDRAIAENDAGRGKINAPLLRLVVGAGDEITIICNARNAYEVAKTYLRELPKGYSSCAGISVFHSHTPFADAYRIAEECCENAKKYMKRKAAEADSREKSEQWMNACVLDYHFNQGAIGVSLEKIRALEETEDAAVPWLVCGGAASAEDVTVGDVNTMVSVLGAFGRGNVKGLLQAARAGKAKLNMEIKRIIAHMPADQRKTFSEKYKAFLFRKEEGDAVREKIRNLIIRMVPVYDIWFYDEDGKSEKARSEYRNGIV